MATAKRGRGKAAKTQPARPAKRTAKKRAVPKAVDEAAMMAAWQKAMTPGDGHARLEQFVGTWETKMTMLMEPGGKPEISTGRSEHRWVLGGRYLEERIESTWTGMRFEGLGYTGYDNVRKKYVGTWMDNFGTGIMGVLGTGKPTATRMESETEGIDPFGKRKRFETRISVQDHDHHTYEMWTKAADGRRFRTMLVEYTRKS